jgi:NAD(P)-dependent dehydrogenase (short-subunit alcohol dehydrogenase family)
VELNGKVAWVVGGSSGIGAAVARELALCGSAVAISGRRKQQLQDVAGEDMLALTADVTDMSSIAAAAVQVQQDLGPIDLTVISAGYWKQMDPSDWDTEVSTGMYRSILSARATRSRPSYPECCAGAAG